MILERRNGSVLVTIGTKEGLTSIVVGKDLYNDLGYYNEDLNHGENLDLDIVKIAYPTDRDAFTSKTLSDIQIIKGFMSNIIWERPKIKEVTLEEIADKFNISVSLLRIIE